MNNLSNPVPRAAGDGGRGGSGSIQCHPIISSPAIHVVLLLLFLIGLGFSIFILLLVHNAIFLVLVLCASALIATFLLWNSLGSTRSAALFFYLHSSPDSDLSLATHGQFVKVTGVVSCENISLESSYEKVNRCIYTSTLLYEYEDFGFTPNNDDARESCFSFNWRIAYSERFSTDFYITDIKSGIRALVKAGADCKVIPLVIESRLVQTTRKCRALSSPLSKWLRERNLSTEARLLCLKEGYIRDGSSLSVIGMFQKGNNGVMIVQPQENISTGCLWRKLLFPADFDGLIIGLPKIAASASHDNSAGI